MKSKGTERMFARTANAIKINIKQSKIVNVLLVAAFSICMIRDYDYRAQQTSTHAHTLAKDIVLSWSLLWCSLTLNYQSMAELRMQRNYGCYLQGTDSQPLPRMSIVIVSGHETSYFQFAGDKFNESTFELRNREITKSQLTFTIRF